MSVTKAQAGEYRLIAGRMRIHGIDGERLYERPRWDPEGEIALPEGVQIDSEGYLDSEKAPTLIELREGDTGIDFAFALKIGSFVPLKKKRKRRG